MIRKHNRSLTREQALAQSVLSGNTGTVYFTTDSHTIIMNGVEYSKSDLKNLEGYFTDDDAKFNYRSTAGSQSVAGQANGDLATIEALYGDSLVWNQLAHDTSFTNTIVDTTSSRFLQIQYLTTSNISKGWEGGDIAGKQDVVDNTYYSWRKTASADASGKWRIKVNGSTNDLNVIRTSGWPSGGVIVDTIIPNHVYYIRLRVKTCDSTTVGGVNIDNIQVFDLSLMFGLGKEPTLAEFETFLANYFPRKDYAYNEGEILSIKSNGIKTVGFNLWDEEWEVGDIYSTTGANMRSHTAIRSKNFIQVFPETWYYFKIGGSSQFMMRYYDINKNYLGYVDYNSQKNARNNTRKMPTNCCYIRFAIGNVTTYNNDICINLAWSGNRNGEYEEYWSETTPIPITTLEGTKSDGTREVMFPDGLCGIGDYKDEIKGNKAIKRIGKVDLGRLTWRLENADYGTFVASLAHLHGGWVNISLLKSSKYPTTSPSQASSTGNKTIRHSGGYNAVRIQDSSYTDAATLKASLQGVYAYYVLGSEDKATPIEYTLDQEFKVDYKVDDYGTEEILPENGTAPITLPIIADIRYGINAVDTLARLHKDYVSVYPQSFNDEQKEQARKNIGVNDTLDGNSFDFGLVKNGDGSIDLDLDVSTIGGESKQKTVELPVATTSQNGLMSSTDKQSLDLNNTPMRLMVLQDQRNSTYNLCVSENAARFIDAGYKPVIYRRMKVKRHFAFNDLLSTRVWKWVPCEEVVLTSLQTSGHQSEYMKIGVPNLLRRKHIVVDTHTIYIGGSVIPISDWLNALGVWNYGSPSHLDDNNHYYAAKDFVIESCPDYIVDYSQSTHKYSQTDSDVYAHHGAARKTLYAGRRALKPFKITLQYGFAFVAGTDITSKRVTDIIPFQLVHTPLENSSAVTSANKGLRWKFRLR